ncbi:MAG TPA: DNA-3-methyladenine glycosylase [Pseudogracilibacillus sp.]|nr:DNA-3-methyladenine glycosylase [Pseudogracilibacillus sp.]
MQPIEESFFHMDTLQLAQHLLGQFVVHELPQGTLIGRIVETEAYLGECDRAAHSFNNRRTKRTEIMFHEPGHVYSYTMHTHTLINVVSGPVGVPHAVLIRAVEPVAGLELMRKNRGSSMKETHLTNGPGKLTEALQITNEYYGHHWTKKPLYIARNERVEQIETSPRIGIKNSGEAARYPWRFFEKDNRFVSPYRP